MTAKLVANRRGGPAQRGGRGGAGKKGWEQRDQTDDENPLV